MPTEVAAGARPELWVGADAPGGLALPPANPTADQLYAPRGVWLDDDLLVVADTGNHRVLIWHGVPDADFRAADVVLGQPDFATEGAQAGGRGPEKGMRLPTGIVVHEGRMVIADAWNHRLLIWDSVPTVSDVAPDAVVGQPDDSRVEENSGGECGPLTMYWPFGLAMIDGRLFVADTGNRRILAWEGLPEPERLPDLLMGQDDFTQRVENRGAVGPRGYRWPHDMAGNSEHLFVADAGNHRILGWRPTPSADVDADLVLGQVDFETAGEFPYGPQSATALRFPYAVDIDGGRMAVADTANNRILLWHRVPAESGVPADAVLAQPDFESNGENRWKMVERDTLCWPYGISLHGDRLAVADSGNNRVMIWRLGA